MAALGAILWSPAAADAILAVLRPEHLPQPWQQQLLQLLAGMHSSGLPIDPVTAGHRCAQHGLRRLGDRPAAVQLCELAAAVPVPASGRYYAQIVIEAAARRRLVQAGQRLTDLAAAPAHDPAALAAAVDAEFRAVADQLAETAALQGTHQRHAPIRALHHPQRQLRPAELDGPELAR
jgi:replicative DNA helicase